MRPGAIRNRQILGGLLLPTATGGYIENPDVATFQEVQRSLDLLAKIILRSLLVGRIEPGRKNKVRNQNTVDFVAILVGLTGIGCLVCVENTRRVRLLAQRPSD